MSSSEQIKIKVSIADREYPLTVTSEEEASLKLAIKRIDELLKYYEDSYAVRDKQDVLAMCTLQFASQLEQHILESNQVQSHTRKRLTALSEKIDAVLLPSNRT